MLPTSTLGSSMGYIKRKISILPLEVCVGEMVRKVLQNEADLLGPSVRERGGPIGGFLHQQLVS